MDIALLNTKILLQRNAVVVDAIGNHTNDWEDYYACHATVGGEGGSEKAAAGQTVEDVDITFTIRYCQKAAAVTADGFRVLFRGEVYNIVAVDHMNFKKKALKFKCHRGSPRSRQTSWGEEEQRNE